MLLSALGAAGPLAAAPNRWQPAAGPYGAYVQALAVAADSAVYAGTLAGALFKSLDGGATWLEADHGLRGLRIFDIKASPADPRALYAATASGIWKSADAGATWEPLPPGSPQAGLLALAPSAPAVLYAGGERVFRSNDGGGTWQEASGGLPAAWFPHVLEVDPRDPNTVYTTWDHLYRTTDGGAHWLPVSSAEPQPFWEMVIDPRHPATLYALSNSDDLIKSTDGGVSWSSASAGLHLLGYVRVPFHLAIDPSSSVLLAAVWTIDDQPRSGEIFRSLDGAASWHAVANSDIQLALAFDPNSRRAYAGTARGMLASANRGARWTASSQGFRGTEVSRVLPDPHNAGTLYAAVFPDLLQHGLGVVRSTDGGDSWAPSGPGLEASGEIHSLAVDPTVPGTLYTAADGGLFKSADAGGTWTRLLDEIGTVSGVAVHPRHSATLYAVGYVHHQQAPLYPIVPLFRAVKSTDGGATWTSFVERMAPGLALATGQFNAVVIDARRPRTVYVAGDQSFKSFDGGVTWTRLPLGTGVGEIVIDPHSSSTLYATNDGATPVARSLDGGTAWQPAAAGLPSAVVHQLVTDDAGTLYAATDQGFYLSLDGAYGWTPLDRGLVDPRALSAAADPLRPGILYAGTAGHGLFIVSRH